MSTRRDQLADQMIEIVAHHGLQGLSVRTLADGCGVSIGTVQHHFPTKDDMLVGAFRRVVERVAERFSDNSTGPARDRLRAILSQLLPLDTERSAEATVMIAFAAAAATQPPLAQVQRQVLDRVTSELAPCFTQLRGGSRVSTTDRTRARLAVATADGLTLHAISAPGSLTADDLNAALEEWMSRLIG